MSDRPRLTVLGTGYLGMTHAACMASEGFEVLGVDIDAEKVARLSAGEVPIFEPGLQELIRDGLSSGRLRFSTSYQEAAEFGDVHFVCVGTPQRRDGHGADLSQVDSCVDGLAPWLTRPCLIVGKSTVPAGTAVALAERVAAKAPAGDGVELCWNPEFLREGHGVQDTLSPDRLVIGVTSAHAEAVLRQVYAPQLTAGIPLFVTDLATAELAKVAANAFLATKISFINAIAEVCDAAGANVTVLADILGADARIGGAFLRPGLGFGGGCLPKDVRAFLARAAELGAGEALNFLREVDAINLGRRTGMVNLACEVAGGSIAGKNVGVLGAAFKPGSDDVRDSPALDVAQILHGMGAEVTVYDPEALESARKVCPNLRYATSAAAAAAGAHVLLLLTDWPEFASLDPEELGTVVAARAIVDGRYMLDPAVWRAAGWKYRASGIPGPAPAEVSPQAL
ncbi:MAG TPA: UDP-glucose/GDP-mannose dehydrogenase family protein [Streptosporangiaceae bacterium]|nr:UDP-glucose/GDP-mannose dehydrogenase family protein [Streptosporangiaceae bacterium]